VIVLVLKGGSLSLDDILEDIIVNDLDYFTITLNERVPLKGIGYLTLIVVTKHYIN
jgi:hypothetical protein